MHKTSKCAINECSSNPYASKIFEEKLFYITNIILQMYAFVLNFFKLGELYGFQVRAWAQSWIYDLRIESNSISTH